ncbi:MAG: DUF2085 domain-containing protein [Candidatus Altiarchaeota archaeon]
MRKRLKRLEDYVRDNVYGNRSTMEFLFLFLLVYALLDAIIIVWFLASPVLAQTDNRLTFGLGMLAYNVGYLTSNCHQMPERSIIFSDLEMPFCSRDTAIYIGCLIGALLPFYVPMPRFAKTLLFAASLMVPMAVDGVSQTIFDLRESSNPLRIVTGLLFGYGIAYYFAVRVVENSRFMDFGREARKVAVMGAIASILLLALGYNEGGAYVTKGEAVEKSGMNPTFVTYVTKRALRTIHYDPYFESYNDPILTAMYNYEYNGAGAWIIYEGPMEYEGKYAFFSGTGGKIRMVPDVSST